MTTAYVTWSWHRQLRFVSTGGVDNACIGWIRQSLRDHAAGKWGNFPGYR